MPPDLDQLLTQATQSPDQFWALVDALRAAAEKDPSLLVTFARHANKVARKAAAAAGGGNLNPYVLDALVALASDPEYDVRQELAYTVKNHPDWPMDRAVETLLNDIDPNTRQSAAWACQTRAALLPELLQRFGAEEDTWVRSEIAHVLGGCSAREVVPVLFERLGKDADVGVQQAC